MVLAFLIILFTVVFGGTHKLDYELLKAVKENKETLTAKSLILKSAGKDLVVREVKVLTKDGKVKVVDLSKRSLIDLMNDPNIVYIEAPRPVSLKNDIVRDISYGVHGSANTSLSINSNTNYFVYVNPSGITTPQSNACIRILLGQVPSSDLFVCSGSETLDISQDFRAVVVGVDKASISGYSEIYLVGTKSTLTPNDGSGVIVGVIDSGINFCHSAFLDANGNTRVKFFGFTMTQEVASKLVNNNVCSSPEPQICCQELKGAFDPNTQVCEFDSTEINNKIQNNDCNWDIQGHGTHVTGIAAGSDSNSLFGTGIAPGADLVVCITTNDTETIKCLEWIKAKSQALNQPTVVNMSLGTHQDPHDGTGLLDRKVDELSGSGFIVVVAQSNEGNKPIHAYTTKTFDIISIQVPELKQNNQILGYFAEIYGWYENPSKWEIALCEPETNNCVKAKSGEDITNQQIGNTGCSASIFMSMENDPLNGDGRFKIKISCDSSQYLDLKLTQICGDVARVDMWDLSETGIFKSGFDTDTYGGYKFTVASPGTAKRAITVGAINSRPDNVLDQNSGSDTFLNLGKIANFSSRGPTRDGRIKPNVVAGGAYVMSANANFDPTNPGTSYVPNAGTSMATPVVTGLVALYLQNNPQATPEDVKKWLTSNAEWDLWDFGISYPNEIYGHGKAVWSDNVGLSGSSQDVLVNIPKGDGVSSCQTPTGGGSGSIGDGNGGSLEEVINDSSGGGGGGCFTVSAGYVLLSAFMISFLVMLRRYYFS